MPNPIIVQARFFEQPGFTELYDTWMYVLTHTDIDAAAALHEIAVTRKNLLEQGTLDPDNLTDLESVACRYAREVVALTAELVEV